jgi:hypothetical protein
MERCGDSDGQALSGPSRDTAGQSAVSPSYLCNLPRISSSTTTDPLRDCGIARLVPSPAAPTALLRTPLNPLWYELSRTSIKNRENMSP